MSISVAKPTHQKIKGSAKTSIPPFIRQYIGVYMTDDSGYGNQIKELVHSIFDKPIIAVPEIGPVPDYIKN